MGITSEGAHTPHEQLERGRIAGKRCFCSYCNVTQQTTALSWAGGGNIPSVRTSSTQHLSGVVFVKHGFGLWRHHKGGGGE